MASARSPPSGRGTRRRGAPRRADPAPPRGGTGRRTRARRGTATPRACRRSGSSGSGGLAAVGVAPVRASPSAAPRGRIDGEPVVVAGDRDPAGIEVLHRLVHAAMPELHLVRRAAERQARAAGGRGRSRTSGCRRRAGSAPPSIPYVVAAGSPGPFDRNDAVETARKYLRRRRRSPGTPWCRSRSRASIRRMFRLIPKSNAATRNAAERPTVRAIDRSDHGRGLVRPQRTRRRPPGRRPPSPAVRGPVRRSDAGSRSTVETAARIAPASRIRSVSAPRVDALDADDARVGAA